jgi:hypothetical protein
MPNINLIIDDCIMHRNIGLHEAHAHEVKTKEPDYETLCLASCRSYQAYICWEPVYYKLTPMPVFHPSDLVGKTFLMDPQEDGQRVRAHIVQAIEDHDGKLDDNPTRIKFLCSINDDESEEIIAYNEILNHIEDDETEETDNMEIQVNHRT